MSRNFSELTCQEFCTPPVKGVKNSVPLPLEVSGIPYPSLGILYPLGPLNNERPLKVQNWFFLTRLYLGVIRGEDFISMIYSAIVVEKIST